MKEINLHIGIVKDGIVYATRIPLELNITTFIADSMVVGHFPLKKLDVSKCEGKTIIVSDESGYQSQIIEVLDSKVTNILEKVLSEKNV